MTLLINSFIKKSNSLNTFAYTPLIMHCVKLRRANFSLTFYSKKLSLKIEVHISTHLIQFKT